jgi:hypothetical protein
MLHELGVSILPVYRIRADYAASAFELWILIPRIVFWLATPFRCSSHGFRSHDPLFFGPQRRKLI